MEGVQKVRCLAGGTCYLATHRLTNDCRIKQLGEDANGRGSAFCSVSGPLSFTFDLRRARTILT